MNHFCDAGSQNGASIGQERSATLFVLQFDRNFNYGNPSSSVFERKKTAKMQEAASNVLFEFLGDAVVAGGTRCPPNYQLSSDGRREDMLIGEIVALTPTKEALWHWSRCAFCRS
jgi:hypothetical protein